MLVIRAKIAKRRAHFSHNPPPPLRQKCHYNHYYYYYFKKQTTDIRNQSYWKLKVGVHDIKKDKEINISYQIKKQK